MLKHLCIKMYLLSEWNIVIIKTSQIIKKSDTENKREEMMTMEQLFYNGDIITMENKEDKPEAVLVRNGIIAAVGTLAEVQAQAGEDCVQTDLQGNTLMPSFVDAHGHLSMTVQYMAMADLSSAKNLSSSKI